MKEQFGRMLHDAFSIKGDIHVVPEGRRREHRIARNCWCAPRQDAVDANLIIHNDRGEA